MLKATQTIHLFNIDRDDFKRGYIETNEDGEINKRKFRRYDAS